MGREDAESRGTPTTAYLRCLNGNVATGRHSRMMAASVTINNHAVEWWYMGNPLDEDMLHEHEGLCVQTFYGHMNSCNSVAFNLKGDTIASADADGIVKLWDIRMVAERMSFNAGPYPANKAAFDHTGEVVATACGDGKIRCFKVQDGSAMCELASHEDAVQAVVFDPVNKYMVSAGSDCTFRLWT
ncbi:hypothetical protein CBR_g48441 [Chara braunii]|uniref:Uncharacterized protein n=1 Tax=Chara braunii TaxID=69332 RepID=A0A388M2M1_CHABU|nr:hypothetical protein CBR_g48441 [Chara braunii]|eukprot:GBG88827.1 hypothetical protein CBR_g48441 [Chara braunii]